MFAFSGTVGFVVDSTLLQVLAKGLGVEVHLARVGSFLVALTCTWLINRHFTFQREPGRHSLLGEWLRYFVSSLMGGLTNYAAFAVSLAVSPFIHEHLVLAVAIGSLAGMCVNYALYSRFVFRKADGVSGAAR